MRLGFFDFLKVFGFLYMIGFGVMYYLSKRNKSPMIIPGDIYKTRGGQITYVPTGGALVVAIALYVIIVRILPGLFGR